MSINPLNEATTDFSEQYDADMHGPRKFIVDNSDSNIAFVRELHNEKLKPYLIDFNTLQTGRLKFLGIKGHVQNIAVEIKYNDPLGKPHCQWFPFERYELRETMVTRLASKEYWFLLPCQEYSPFGILLALETFGIKLTLEDVEFTQESEKLFRMEAMPKSLGWYGEVFLEMV